VNTLLVASRLKRRSRAHLLCPTEMAGNVRLFFPITAV
jgi:hypothetical protein